MKRAALLITLLAATLPAAPPNTPPRVTRAALKALEEAFDQTIGSLNRVAPYDLLGSTRGIYLAGYGVVFTAEMDLVVSPATPFHRAPDKEGIVKLREAKLQRLDILKHAMRQMLAATAARLETVPPSEQIVLGVSLLYRSYENREGLPNQVIMLAPRQALLDAKSDPALKAALRVDEF